MNYERNHYLDAYKQFYQVELTSLDIEKCEKFLMNCVHLQDLFNRTFMDVSTVLGSFLKNKGTSRLAEAHSQIISAMSDTQRSPLKQKSQRCKFTNPPELFTRVDESGVAKPVGLADLVFNPELADKKTLPSQPKQSSILSPEGMPFKFKGKQFPATDISTLEAPSQKEPSPAKDVPLAGCQDCRKYGQAMRTPDNEIVYVLSQKCARHRVSNEPRPFTDLKPKNLL